MTKASGCGVELSRNRSVNQEAFVSHANAALTPRARLRPARLVVDEGWPVARAAERYDVSWPTAKRWAGRYAEFGAQAMDDRSSRPHRSPARTPQPTVRKVVHLRWKQRLGPVQIAGRLGMPASTVHAVPTRCRVEDPAPAEPLRNHARRDRRGTATQKKCGRKCSLGAVATAVSHRARYLGFIP